LDANPTADRLRVVSDAERNLRLNPVDGTLAGFDTNLFYPGGDPNQGQDPNVVGSAYANNYDGASTTTLYGVDSNLDLLLIQNPPNSGVLNTVGALGFDTDGRVGFDIAAGSNTAYASMTAPLGGTSSLFTVNLSTGAGTLVGQIGPGGYAVQALALGVAPLPAPPPATPTVVPAPTTTPPDTTAPTVLLAVPSGLKIAKVLKSGVSLEFSCDEACTADATLTAGGSSRAAATTTVGQGKATLTKAGIGKLQIKLTRSGKRYVTKRRRARVKRLRLSLAVAVSDAAANKRTLAKKLTLTR
jgi:hypothetical protein